MIQNAIAVILGGGVGSRLYPLTQDRSKPAVPIGGKYRLIDIPISNCLNSGLKRMFVLTQYNSASLNKHIKKAFHFDIFTRGFVDILAAEQTRKSSDWFQGTADAVRQSLLRLEIHEYDYVIILSGDQLYQMDLRTILDHHLDNSADVTVATIPVDSNDAPAFGILKVDESDQIIDFVEKPPSETLDQWSSPLDKKYTDQSKNFLASMGIYVFNKKALLNLFEEMPEAIDFGKEIIPYAVNNSNYKTASFPFGGYWTDIGSIASYFEANIRLTQYLPEFNLFDNSNQVYTSARMLSPTKVFGTKLSHTLISDGCIIHATEISDSIIGIRSRIGSNTFINRSVVMGNDYYQALHDLSELDKVNLLGIGKDCTIKNAILDKNVKIGDNVSIIGGEGLPDDEQETHCIKDGIIILRKGAIIPDNTSIGLKEN